MKQWDMEHTEKNHYDPTAILSRMAELLEKETNVFKSCKPGQYLINLYSSCLLFFFILARKCLYI